MVLEQNVDLIERAKKKEPGAFDILYDEYKIQAYRTAVFLTGNEEDAQDVVQDTFVTVCLEIGKLKKPEAFISWFYRILTHNAIRYIKKRKREISRESLEEKFTKADSALWEDFTADLLRQEENRQIRYLVDQLGEKYRTVVVLYYFNNFSVREIARITGCLEGTVKSRLFKARKLLEEKLTGKGGGKSDTA